MSAIQSDQKLQLPKKQELLPSKLYTIGLRLSFTLEINQKYPKFSPKPAFSTEKVSKNKKEQTGIFFNKKTLTT